MARGRGAVRNRGRNAPARDVPGDVFRDMLGELGSATVSDSPAESSRPVKRRRTAVGRSTVKTKVEPLQDRNGLHKEPRPVRASEKKVDPAPRSVSPEDALQAIDFNPQSSSDEEHNAEISDDEFEDVQIDGADLSTKEQGPSDASGDAVETLDLVLGNGKEADETTPRRRRIITTISDKKLVANAHKLHLLCLLSHLSLRNHWCNDTRTHRLLRKLVPRKAREQMTDDENSDQFTRDQRLRNGLRQTVESFGERFRKNARGLIRAWWDAPDSDSSPALLTDMDVITSVDDFRDAASNLAGSRDLGAQLFCAMLRSIGLEVRLVCSLQPLPLNGSIRPEAPDARAARASIVRYQETRAGMGDDSESAHDTDPSPSKSAKEENDAWKVSSIRRRLGGGLAQPPTQSTPRPARPTPPRIRESSAPIFWTEVFSPAYQKWIPVDPLVTETIGQASKLGPAQSDIRNSLSYVVGMDEDGSFRDVTRRYAAHFNAKTRKTRLDAVAGSENHRWWKRVLRVYAPVEKLARDDIEDAEMQRREEREGMPKNVEDFKGHPLYVLERHLRRNEVIHPKREVGRTGAGKSGVELVFRRRDVHTVKSVEAWYRVGRELKADERPLKRHVPKRKARASAGMDDNDDDEEENSQNLYAVFQTDAYRAPPVKNGRVPRNVYGNLDVYVPSMIPPGAVHFLHPSTKHAAKLLGIDYVDAVTGFEFKGRQGSAVVRGAVVAAEFKDAVLEVLQSMANEKAAAEAALLSRESLRLWHRFLAALRIKERLAGYDAPGERENDDNGDADFRPDDAMDEDERERAMANEGGFESEIQRADVGRDASFPQFDTMSANDASAFDFTIIEGPRLEVDKKAVPTSGPSNSTTKATRVNDDVLPGGFVQDDAGGFSVEEGGGFIEKEGGGFVQEGDEGGVAEGGGFLHEEDHGVPDIPGQKQFRNALNDSLDGAVDEHQDTASLFEGAQEDAAVESVPTEVAVPADADIADATTNGREPSSTADIVAQVDPKDVPATNDTEDDRGSLLSEDPDDSDAIPDWLA